MGDHYQNDVKLVARPVFFMIIKTYIRVEDVLFVIFFSFVNDTGVYQTKHYKNDNLYEVTV